MSMLATSVNTVVDARNGVSVSQPPLLRACQPRVERLPPVEKHLDGAGRPRILIAHHHQALAVRRDVVISP